MIQQGKLLLVLELFIGTVMVAYFWLTGSTLLQIVIIILFSLIGIGGSFGVAWYGIRINTLANSRTAFASLKGLPYAGVRHPAAGGHERGHDADLGRAAVHARHPALHPRVLRRRLLPRLRHRRVPGRVGPAHRGRDLHQDRGHRLRPDEDRLQDQGGRRPQPRRHRGLHGRQRRRLRRPHRGRLRDLRRHRRGPHLLHPARGARRAGAGEAAGLDLRHPRDDGARLRALVRRQRSRHQGPLRHGHEDGLRGPAHPARLADLDRLRRAHLRRLVPDDPRARRRQPVVEALHDHHLRHAGRRDHPRAGQGLHLDQLRARARGGRPRRAKAARR